MKKLRQLRNQEKLELWGIVLLMGVIAAGGIMAGQGYLP